MTSSRLNGSTNNLVRWGARLPLVASALLLGLLVIALPSLAEARRRIVILDFEGPKAAQFRVDVERLVKKSHMVIPVDKWNSAAEEMDATSMSEKDVKKVAKRLNIDGVISGKVEKRRDEYILRLKVREGKTGEIVGNPIDTKTGGARLDGAATREIKSELFDTLDVLDTGGGGGDSEEAEEEEERPRKFVKRKGEAEEPAEEEEEEVVAKPTKGKKGKPVEEEEEEEEEEVVVAKPTKGKKEPEPVAVAEVKPTKGKKEPEPVAVAEVKPTKGKKEPEPVAEVKPTKGKKEPTMVVDEPVKPEPVKVAKVEKTEDKPFVPKTKPKKTVKKAKPKQVASDDDISSEDAEEASVSDSFEPLTSDVALNHAHRAIDVTGGMSFTMRRLRFKSSGLASPATPPRSFDSVPVAGLTVDGEAYPLAFGHKKQGVLTNIGVTASFDRTFAIRTRLRYNDDATGAQREKELQSTYQRFTIGAIYRHNLGTPSSPLVVTGALRYGSQSFEVDRGGLMPKVVDIPSVSYTMIEPSAGIRYGLGRRISVGAEAGILLMTGIGDIQEMDSYGAATVTGFEGEAFFDYMITGKVFARAAFRAETIGMKFKGFGALSNMRDSDPEQDVSSARDTYFGGAVTAGYVF